MKQTKIGFYLTKVTDRQIENTILRKEKKESNNKKGEKILKNRNNTFRVHELQQVQKKNT